MANEKTYEWVGINEMCMFRNDVCCFEADSQHPVWSILENFKQTMSLLLIQKGSLTCLIDGKSHCINHNHLIFITPLHSFKILTVDAELRVHILLMHKDIVENIRGLESSFKHVILKLKTHHQPIISLQPSECGLLSENLLFLKKRIFQTEHLYQKELIYSALSDLLFEIGNIYGQGEKRISFTQTHSDHMMNQFTQLLLTHYKSQHEVTFYSSQLNISPQYLASIIKNATGQTVGTFIYDLLFDEACNLLLYSQMSVQQIADELHFSDQSAFGKFFKRKSGVSPNEYRKLPR